MGSLYRGKSAVFLRRIGEGKIGERHCAYVCFILFPSISVMHPVETRGKKPLLFIKYINITVRLVFTLSSKCIIIIIISIFF